MQASFVALDRSLASSITIPLEMLYAARTVSQVNHGDNTGLSLRVVGQTTEPVTFAGGLKVKPDTALHKVDRSDLIFVPGMWGSPAKFLRQNSGLLDWLAHCHENGSTICSLGSGSFYLAEAGLLDGRSATTHWYYFDLFQARYPGVRLDRKRFITRDSNLYCTGSVNAARDVALHVVEEIFGDSVAREIARHFTHEIKRSYESMLLNYEQQDIHHDEAIIKAQEILQKRYHEPVTMEAMAENLRMSVRTFNRRFRSAAGITPLQYLQEIRIDQAKQLLKQSNLTIAEISFAVGYQDPSHFSGLFRKVAGVKPVEYRKLVRSKLFKVE